MMRERRNTNPAPSVDLGEIRSWRKKGFCNDTNFYSNKPPPIIVVSSEGLLFEKSPIDSNPEDSQPEESGQTADWHRAVRNFRKPKRRVPLHLVSPSKAFKTPPKKTIKPGPPFTSPPKKKPLCKATDLYKPTQSQRENL
jgi:hypothetical protein